MADVMNINDNMIKAIFFSADIILYAFSFNINLIDMKFDIIEEKENPLLKRKEILIRLDYEGSSTPSKAELQKLFADHFKANIENVEISKVLSEIGLTRGKVWIKIWKEKKVPIYSELKKEKKKEKPPEPKKEKQKPTEEKTEEEKSEEKKEEPKPEEPKEEIKEEVKEKPKEKVEGEETAEESKEQEQTQESSDVEKVQGQEV
jgi:ribosomal protein S24E